MRLLYVLPLLSLFSCYGYEDDQPAVFCEVPFTPQAPPGYTLEALDPTFPNRTEQVEFSFFGDFGFAYGVYQDSLSYTENAGRTWASLPPVPEGTSTVHWANRNEGLAIIAAGRDPETGLILNSRIGFTNNGGQSWEVITYPDEVQRLKAATIGPDGNIYALGRIGEHGLLHSTNGGQSFELMLPIPLAEYYGGGATANWDYDLYPGEEAIYVNTRIGGLAISYDGQTVQPIGIDLDFIKSVRRGSDGSLRVVRHSGSDQRSSDNGATFTPRSFDTLTFGIMPDGNRFFITDTPRLCPTDSDQNFGFMGVVAPGGTPVTVGAPSDEVFSWFAGRHDFRDGRILLLISEQLYLLQAE